MEKLENALFLIPTPISNDAFFLNESDAQKISSLKFFAVESVKNAKKFLSRFFKSVDLDNLTFFEIGEHCKHEVFLDCLKILRAGNSVGVISDAGCPAVADPGAILVSLCHENSIRVVPLVGPSSILLSLMASGFCGQNFSFLGYLPVKDSARRAKIRAIENLMRQENQTQIFIETPYRNEKIFSCVLEVCRADTKFCVAVDLTGKNEFVKTKTISQWKKSVMPDIQKRPAIFLLGN